jgi:tetratricopeptide (TPR) repeat protein
MADRLKIGMTFRKILPLLLIIAVPEIFAQETQTFMKLRLAHGLEDSGEWEQAIRIYEELYLLEPNNFAVVDGLQHAYAQIKEYGKAIVTVRKWLVFQSRDVSMEARLGGLYFDSGDERAADSVWSAIIKSEPLNVQAYRIVSGEMTLHRLYEKSISVYTEGRSRIGNNILFADELGTLYAALLQYGQAAGEYIRLVKYSPDQMYFAQSRMSSFITRPEAARSAAAVMSSEIKSTPANTALRRLNAWLLIEEKKYGEALEEYRVIDKLTNAEGSEIFNFAQRLSRESLYALAAEAFREIIGSGKNMQLIPYARYGYAFSVERLNGGAGGDTSEQACREVLELYESIVRSYPRTDLAAQALLRIGIVRYERLSDLDGALDALRHVEKVRPSSNYAYESWLKTGEVLTARNELEKRGVNMKSS